MYESSIDQGKAMLQPLTDFLTFERTAAETLFRRNLGYTTEIFLANVRHFGALGATLNPAILFGAQAAFVNDMGQRFFETATENFETLVGAGEAMMAQVLVSGQSPRQSPRQSLGKSVLGLAFRPAREESGNRAVALAGSALELVPGFLDAETGKVYPSCFADGQLAPVHLLDAVPEELVSARDAAGKARTLRPSVVSGFVSGTRFYTREEAARLVEERDEAAN
jgi:hypothetical protein